MSLRRKLVLFGFAVVAIAAGLAIAFVLDARQQDAGRLETEVTDVSLESTGVGTTETTPPPEPPTPTPTPTPVAEGPCWRQFGGDPARTLSRPTLRLGPPKKALWARGLRSYIEYPPVFCDGLLYVNTFRGTTFAIDADTGRIRWRTPQGAPKPSAPAIFGRLVIVTANDGTVTAYERFTGSKRWRLSVGSRVESSPLVIDERVYFAAADGRLFAADAATGRVAWAFATGAEVNASPTAVRNGVCITNYGGAVFCVRRSDGQKQWSTYVRRDSLRFESFYASASTDGERIYTIARSGKVVALDAASGRIVWTQPQQGYGYSTPAVSGPRVFVGGFDGALHAYRATTGERLWSRYVGGRVLGAPVLIGDLVFFATLEQRTYAVRAATGELVWSVRMGKYSPTIATRERYYMALNGLLVAYRPTNPPPRLP